MRAWRSIRLRSPSSYRPAASFSQRTPYDQSLKFPRFSTTTSDTPPESAATPPSTTTKPLRREEFAIFNRTGRPDGRIESWVALLVGALPPHLRNWDSSAALPPNLSAADAAEVLLAAQYLSEEDGGPMDLLHHLGFEQNRWSAVIWLVKGLVDKFHVGHDRLPRLSRVSALWEHVPSLAEASASPISLSMEERIRKSGLADAKSLHELTDRLQPENMSKEERLRHKVLGQLWRTLGSMTTTCAKEGDIRPEVLEIIAYLHHREVMPLFIYQTEQPADKCAIRQPPLLSMLSSRILTSLSDAAWRAHERVVVEEANARDGKYAPVRPEVPGSVYRVHVAGLRPEVWMELVLWSCLHGGWIEQGSEIIQDLLQRKWRILGLQHWEDLESRHGWGPSESFFKSDNREPQQIARSISAEVVNAYIDALVTMLDIGVGSRGIETETVLKRLGVYKAGMHNQNLPCLTTGSWNSVILRIVESGSIVLKREVDLVQSLARLSQTLRQNINSQQYPSVPAYVMGGTMALHGFCHQALDGQITAGSLSGALTAFSTLQRRVDGDIQESIDWFFGKHRPRLLNSFIRADMFTSNLTGIEYPTFNLQIPPIVLGAFLELLVDKKEYELARWLLLSNNVDGPVIGEALYKDPVIQPAVMRFALETQDKTLLSKLPQLDIARGTILSSLNVQVNNARWDSATQILHYLSSSEGPRWTISNLANIVRVMLMQVPGAKLGNLDHRENLRRAKGLLRDILRSCRQGAEQVSAVNLLVVLSAVNSTWARFCAPFRLPGRYMRLSMRTENFNVVLEGVVQAYGSAAGRRLLGIFWPHSARRAYDAKMRIGMTRRSRMRMARHRPQAIQSVSRTRIVLPTQDDQSGQGFIAVYGAVIPTSTTVLIILHKALEEQRAASEITATQPAEAQSAGDPTADAIKSKSYTPLEMVTWGVRRLTELDYGNKAIIVQIDRVLEELGLEDLRFQLPQIVHDAENGTEDDAEGHADEDLDGVASEPWNDPNFVQT